MIKDNTFENAYHNVVSVDVNLAKQRVRVRTKLCKDSDPDKDSGISNEFTFNEDVLINESMGDAEGQINFDEINASALKKIKSLKDDGDVLSKKDRDRIVMSFKNTAIAREAKKIGIAKLKKLMDSLAFVKEIGEKLITK